MDLWSPPRDAPHLLEWWRPLMLVSRQARVDRFPWPVHLDEFRLAGRVKRQGRPDIWIYDHHENSGSVCVDSTGQTYKFIATPRAKGVGQFRPCDLRSALWRARLPEVVEPVSYEGSRPGAWDTWLSEAADQAAAAAESDDVFDDEPDEGGDGETAAGGAGVGGAGGAGDDVDAGGVDGRRVVRRGHLTLIAG